MYVHQTFDIASNNVVFTKCNKIKGKITTAEMICTHII